MGEDEPKDPVQLTRFFGVGPAEKAAIPDWYHEIDFYRARIDLGEDDHVVVLPMSRQSMDSANALVTALAAKTPVASEVWPQIDDILRECIVETHLDHWATIVSKGRAKMGIEGLPLHAINRILQGLVVHAGNF